MRLDQARDFWRSRGVPEHAIEHLWTMAEAARVNDALAEEHTAEHVLVTLGWSNEAAEYMGQQRAIRAVMAWEGGAEILREMARTMDPIAVAGMPQPLLDMLATVWIDGFLNACRSVKLRG